MNTVPATPHIGIVIVSYNTRALLQQAIESTRLMSGATSYPRDVVVVDNASTDGSADMVRQDYPRITLIANTTNRGFAAATNQGISAVWDRSDLILLLNPDARLCLGALEELAAFMEAHPRVGATGARLLYPDGRPQEGAWHFPSLLMAVFDLFPPRGPLFGRLYGSSLNGRYAEERQDVPFPIDHPLGAAMLIRRATLADVGLLDEGYWMYVEEVDWCFRCRRAGWAIWQIPTARVVHAGGASSRQVRSRSFIALHRSRLRFARKWRSIAFLCWYKRIIRMGMVWATLKSFVGWRRGHLDLDQLRAQNFAYGHVVGLTFEATESRDGSHSTVS